MDPVSAIAIYFVIWWIVFFLVLTIGDRTPDSTESWIRGSERGAPARARIGRRVAITTLAALVVFAAVYGILHAGLTFDDIPLPRPPAVPEYGEQ